MDAFLEPGPGLEPLEHVPDVPGRHGAARQSAEQRAAPDPVLTAPVDPPGDGIQGARIEAYRPGPVPFAMQDAQRAIRGVHVGRPQRQGLADPQPGPVHDRNQRPVADTGRRPHRAPAQQERDLRRTQRGWRGAALRPSAARCASAARPRLPFLIFPTAAPATPTAATTAAPATTTIAT